MNNSNVYQWHSHTIEGKINGQTKKSESSPINLNNTLGNVTSIIYVYMYILLHINI